MPPAYKAALLLAWIGLSTLPTLSFSADPTDDEGLHYFETHIRPLLVEHCYDCHSADYAESDLALDSWEGIRTGGKAGTSLVPGKPEQSLLLTAVGYHDATLQMPPDSKLPADAIAKLKEWIERGAPYPGAKDNMPSQEAANDLEARRNFWSFQPIQDPVPPQVNDRDWATLPIDRFILAQLEANGLSPAPPAAKRTLLRRVTYDVTGLPPTAEEMEAFLADTSPQAFERVVDRLLASTAYGERWGRHWLDVARYADSNGLDENVAHGNAWRYRDYVVNAFNKDKPYDDFVREQLAGDLLPYRDYRQHNEQLTATGFLALGPKVLAEVDKVKMEMDIIDEQIDTVGRGFMGLTLGCARCHDHKFDPLLAADYYGLAGIFKSTKTMESYNTVGMWHENPIPTPNDSETQAAHASQVAAKKSAIQQLVDQATAKLKETQAELPETPEKIEGLFPTEIKQQLKQQRDELATLEKAAPTMPMAMGVTERETTDVAVHIRGSHLTLGDVVPRRFPLVLVSTENQVLPTDSSGRLAFADWLTSGEHPLTARVIVNRIWRWHFGQGIVNTPDNFGELGDRPSHPELLDWLARDLMHNGWSIKALHRKILLSNTYQMSGTFSASAAEQDPSNRLLWRMAPRRMEAEELRDSLLAVSGQLDFALGGNLLPIENHDYIFNHTSMDATQYDTPRRSIYLPVIRNNLFGQFQLFDFADASVVTGNRSTSTVAPQALYLLNSDLVIDTAEVLSKDLTPTAEDGTSQSVNRLYEQVLGRPAEPAEIEQAEYFLAECTALEQRNGDPHPTHKASARFCQVVLASNEFIFIR